VLQLDVKLPGGHRFIDMEYPYPSLPEDHRGLQPVDDITDFDAIEDKHSKWLRASESRTLDQLFALCTDKNTGFVKTYHSFLNKKWQKTVKTVVPDARKAAELLTGIPGQNGNPPLEKNDIVATFIDPATTKALLTKYGMKFWIGKVRAVFDESKDQRQQQWARNGDGPHFDFQVRILF
jgi:hypothetical protein